jgi:cobalt-zinc-cadmium efflux system membrane fusion protein
VIVANIKHSTCLLFAAALASLAVVAGCSHGGSSGSSSTAAAQGAQPAQQPDYVAPDAKGIQTVVVKTTSVPEYFEITAHIEADPTSVVHVYPPAGGRIIEMRVRPWDHVSAGQSLALIESSDLSRAVADYHKAQADDAFKKKALARAQDLFEHHAIAERDYQQAQADSQMSQADLAAASEQIRVLGMDPDQASTELRLNAPRAGVILDVGAAPGEFSNALAAPAPLCTIADISTIWAVGDIYENELTSAKQGEQAQVTLSAYPGRTWTGRVSVVSGAVDPATRTLHLRVILPNPGELIKPAMFGSIRLLRSSSQGILVPASAVVREENAAYVFVSTSANHFQRRDVTLGRAVDASLEITKGLNQGDTIVSTNPLLLRAASEN